MGRYWQDEEDMQSASNIKFTAGLRLRSRDKQELGYRKQIARQLCIQYVEGIYRPKYYTVTLKSRLRVTQGHWKRNHLIHHTRLTVSSYLTLNIIVTLKCGLQVTQGHSKWYHLKAWIRFPICLP